MELTFQEKMKSYVKVVLFLLMEVMAVCAFSLGNSFIFQSIIIIILAIVASVVSYIEYKKEEFTTFLFFLFPLFMFGLLAALSNFTSDPAYVLGKNIGANLLISFGLGSFALTGYLLSSHVEIKISKVIFVIYCALAAYVLINFLATMVQFEPFYTLKYKNYHVYYDGQMNPTPVGEMAFALMGFSFKEVSIQYYTFFANILLSSCLGLLFVKYKENKKQFIAYVAFTAIALISLLFTINKMSIFFTVGELLVIATIFLLYKYKEKINFKYVKFTAGVIAGFIGVLLIIFILNSQNFFGEPIKGIRDAISGNSFLDRLFNSNYFARKIQPLFDGIFDFKSKTYGYITMSADYFPKGTYTDGMYPIGSWFFDSFLVAGLFGAILLAFFIGFGIKRMFNYFKTSDDGWDNKILIAGFVFSILFYGLYGYDTTPYVYSDDISPITLCGLFSIAIFLMSYCFYRSNQKVEKLQKEEGNALNYEETIEL